MRSLWHTVISITWFLALFLTTPSRDLVGTMHPLMAAVHHMGATANAATLPCAQPESLPRCYTPRQIQQAYNVLPLFAAGVTGTGQTIVIIAAYQSPTLHHDLHTFDRLFHLPDPVLVVQTPHGMAAFDPSDLSQVAWAGEITLDVEWAHALAPGAHLTLVEARSPADNDILAALRWAIRTRSGTVISQSFGEAEDCMTPATLATQHALFVQAVQAGMTPVAAAGDTGAALPDCADAGFHRAVSSPASDPLVLAVGGTQLAMGRTHQESVWNDDGGATGGGYSAIYARPSYQNGVTTNRARGLPDVAADADPQTGVLCVWSASGAGADQLFTFGGTSASTPMWAGILALAAQRAGHGLGWVQPALYASAAHQTRDTFDITQGTNTVSVPDGNGFRHTIPGTSAQRGWDAVTGWGSPNARLIVLALAHPTSQPPPNLPRKEVMDPCITCTC
ncbi:MAG: S53 family peptidase [Ktedonobacterales bacterium]|nr:S53 family peptidase [Ktedonobacterales bacterium]